MFLQMVLLFTITISSDLLIKYLKEYSKRKTSYKKNNFLLITFGLIIGLIPCIFIPHLFLFWIPATLYSFREWLG